ncbi:MAG: hypothetical protein EAZ58_02195, partial [Flavobacterium sp.]
MKKGCQTNDILFLLKLKLTKMIMTVHNSYQIVKVFNSLCVSAPLREIELAKARSRKEKNELSYEIVQV